MKVIYVGYCKTGTTSIANALRILGYKVYDFKENFQYLCEEWTKILKSGECRPEDLRKMYEGVDAVTDVPVYHYWRQFVEAFPKAKVCCLLKML